MSEHLTAFGIPGLGAVPYGVHVCQFYPSRALLIDALLPFFRAGLDHNERCIWVAGPPLPENEAREEAAKSPELKQAIESGQLAIFEAADWYGDPATLDPDKIIQRWLDAEEQALADGFNGLRITGNTSFIPRDHWQGLFDYEKKLHERIVGRRIVACCSYHREELRPVDVFDVVQCHDGALEHGDKHWEVHLHTLGQRR